MCPNNDVYGLLEVYLQKKIFPLHERFRFRLDKKFGVSKRSMWKNMTIMDNFHNLIQKKTVRKLEKKEFAEALAMIILFNVVFH